MQFAMSAMSQGEKVLFVTFDETKHILMTRRLGMGWDLRAPIADRSSFSSRSTLRMAR
jgi:circadian clock protein KaiC